MDNWYTIHQENIHNQQAVADEDTGGTIAVTYNDANGHHANLIAAAPDMLKALQLLYDTGEDSSMYDYAKSKATAAINKAKGETE